MYLSQWLCYIAKLFLSQCLFHMQNLFFCNTFKKMQKLDFRKYIHTVTWMLSQKNKHSWNCVHICKSPNFASCKSKTLHCPLAISRKIQPAIKCFLQRKKKIPTPVRQHSHNNPVFQHHYDITLTLIHCWKTQDQYRKLGFQYATNLLSKFKMTLFEQRLNLFWHNFNIILTIVVWNVRLITVGKLRDILNLILPQNATKILCE